MKTLNELEGKDNASSNFSGLSPKSFMEYISGNDPDNPKFIYHQGKILANGAATKRSGDAHLVQSPFTVGGTTSSTLKSNVDNIEQDSKISGAMAQQYQKIASDMSMEAKAWSIPFAIEHFFKGASSTGAGFVTSISQIPGIVNQTRQNDIFDHMVVGNREAADEALNALTNYLGQDVEEDAVEFLDVNKLRNPDGSELSDDAKKILEQYKQAIASNRKVQSLADIKQDMLSGITSDEYTFGNYKTKRDTLKAVSQMAGNVAASYFMFGGSSLLPRMAGAAMATRATTAGYKTLAPILFNAGRYVGNSAVFSLSFVNQAVDIRNMAIAQGKSISTANAIGSLAGAFEATVEMALGMKALNGILTADRSFRNLLYYSLQEGTEEFIQSAGGDVITNITGLTEKQFTEIATDAMISFVGGAVGSLVFAAGDAFGSQREARIAALTYRDEQAMQRQKEAEEQMDADTGKISLPQAQFQQQSTESQTQEKQKELQPWQKERLQELKEDYERKAKQANKNITDKQLEKGWEAVERIIDREANTGEFSAKIMSAIEQVNNQQALFGQMQTEGKQQLSKMLSAAGVNPNASTEIIKRLTSKDANEKFNAEMEVVEQSIVRDFASIDPTGKQSAAFAKQLTSVMRDTMLLSGMSPLEFYQSIKPTVYSLPVAHITGQLKNPILSAIQFPAQQDISSARAKAIETLTKIKLLADEGVNDNNAAMLQEVNMELYGNDNLEDTTGLYTALDSQASILANIMYSELGWHIGSELTRDDFRTMSLLYSQGYEMQEIADMFSLNTGELKGNQINEAFENALNKLYPKLTDEQLENVEYISRLFTEEGIAEEQELQSKENDLSDELEKEAKQYNKNKELFDSVDTRSSKTKFIDKAVREDSPASKYFRAKAAEIMNSNVSEIKGVYDADTNTIVVRDLNSATGFHEMQHFLLSKVIFDRFNLVATDKVANLAYGTGQIKKLAEMINDAMPDRINDKKVTDVAKQETLVEAIIDYTMNGSTGVQEIDAILNNLSSDIKGVVHSPKGSLYNQMSQKAKNKLSNSIKNLFVPTTPGKMIDGALELEGMLFNNTTEEIVDRAIQLIDEYAIPEGDSYKAQLELGTLDYTSSLALFQKVINDMRAQAVNLVLQENPAQSPVSSYQTTFYDALTVDQALKTTQDERLLDLYSKGVELVEKFNPKRYGINNLGDLVNKAYNTWSWAKGLGVSLIDRANKISPQLGEVINRAQQKYNKDTKEMLVPATNLSKLVSNHFKREADQVNIKKNFYRRLKKLLINSESRDSIRTYLVKELGAQDGAEAFGYTVQMLNTLDVLYRQLVEDYGLTGLTYVNNYFPRYVIQSNRKLIDKKFGLSAANNATKILRARGDSNLSSQEAQDKIDRLNGLAYARNEHESITLAHSRVIEKVDDDILDAYEDPIEAYTKYIKDANRTIMVRTLFGRQVREDPENTVKNLRGGPNQSKTGEIGKILAGLGYADLSGVQDEEFDEIYRKEQRNSTDVDAFFTAVGRYLQRTGANNAIYDITKSAITLTTITNYITALSQMEEIITTGLNYGFTFFQDRAFKALGAKLAEDKVTIDNLNLEPLNDILRDVSSSGLSQATSIAMKLSMFQYMDTNMKNRTLEQIRLALVKMQKGEEGFKYERLRKRCEDAFAYSGPKRLDAALKAIEEGKINKGGQAGEDAKYLIVSLFADQQPIDSANVPEMYNGLDGFGKLSVFALQTVGIKQNSAMLSYINDAFNKDFLEGMKAILSYIFMSVLIGVPLDAVKNMLKLQPINIKDSMIYHPMQIFFINEYDVNVLSREGVGSMISEKFAPPLRQLTTKGKGHAYKIMPVIGPTLYAIYNTVTARARALYEQLSDYEEDIEDAINGMF